MTATRPPRDEVPMLVTALAIVATLLAAVPALVFVNNLRYYRPCPPPMDGDRPSVSVVIPARNEEHAIAAAAGAVLASRGVDLELIVVDDHSEDGTGAILRELARRDPRVRLPDVPPLPPGWSGKQHACAVGAAAAASPLIVFLDADVRIGPDALARMAAFVDRSGADLASGIPFQETGTFAEQLLIPLIHFVLLGFLPMGRMRRYPDVSYAAGCGQLFIARRPAYEAMGGHAAIRDSLHDGLKLPRAFRAAGFRTDLFDATDLARCRMYRGLGETWRGLAKNAVEGLASPGLIGPATLMLLGGQVMPFVLLANSWVVEPLGRDLLRVAVALAWAPRVVGVVKFRQPALGAILHPYGVLALVAIQWYALARWLLGRPSSWKGRSYAGTAGDPAPPARVEVDS